MSPTCPPAAMPRELPFPSPAAAEFRRLRDTLGLTQAQLARRLDYDVKTVKRWEACQQEPREVALELMRRWSIKPPRPDNLQDARFTFIDLFAGIGGLRRGFEGIGGRCVFTSEKDEHCHKTYRENFFVDHIHGDIIPIPS